MTRLIGLCLGIALVLAFGSPICPALAYTGPGPTESFPAPCGASGEQWYDVRFDAFLKFYDGLSDRWGDVDIDATVYRQGYAIDDITYHDRGKVNSYGELIIASLKWMCLEEGAYDVQTQADFTGDTYGEEQPVYHGVKSQQFSVPGSSVVVLSVHMYRIN